MPHMSEYCQITPPGWAKTVSSVGTLAATGTAEDPHEEGSLWNHRENTSESRLGESSCTCWFPGRLLFMCLSCTSIVGELSSLRAKRSLKPYLWWWLQGCTLISRHVNLYILNMYIIFVCQSYFNIVVEKIRTKRKCLCCRLWSVLTTFGVLFLAYSWERNWLYTQAFKQSEIYIYQQTWTGNIIMKLFTSL